MTRRKNTSATNDDSNEDGNAQPIQKVGSRSQKSLWTQRRNSNEGDKDAIIYFFVHFLISNMMEHTPNTASTAPT